MDLSTAIREGATKRPQCFGDLFALVATRGGRTVIGSCAMGAAYEALGQVSVETAMVPGDAWATLQNTFPALREADVRCPMTKDRGDDCRCRHHLGYVITHLNDSHQWSRERIADWLETR